MDSKDRKFVTRLAQQLTTLKGRVTSVEKKVQRIPAAGASQTILDTRQSPHWVIVSRFQVKDVNTVEEQKLIQQELQQLLTDFCKEAEIEELSILFRT